MAAARNPGDAGNERTILVFGATGAQGGSVARFLMQRGRFRVRALTRRPESDRARALKEAGAEVVRGDLARPETLGPALRGCWGVYGVTNYWEHFDGEEEHGRNLADAVAESDVGFFIFSALPHVSQVTDELSVPHFDIKARVADYCRERDLPVALVYIAFYYENFIHFMVPRPAEGGGYVFGFPQGDAPLAAVSVADVGGIIAPMFEDPDRFVGETIPIVGDLRRATDYAAAMSRAVGAEVKYEHIPREVYAGFDFPGAADLADMFDFYRRYDPYTGEDLDRSRELYPGIRPFDEWIAPNAPALKEAIEAQERGAAVG